MHILALLIFGPFITFGIVDADLSPIYLVCIIIYSFLREAKDRKYLYFTILISALILIIEGINGSIDLRLTKFCATLLVADSCFKIAQSKENILCLNFSYALISVLWLITGILTLYDNDIFRVFLYRVGYSEGRGATGLTPEPSYFGLCSVFLYALSKELVKKNYPSKYKFTSYLYLLSTLASTSIQGIGVLILLIFYYERKVNILKFILISILPLLIIEINFAERLVYLISGIIKEGITFLSEDASIAYRIANFNYIFGLFKVGAMGDPEDMLASGITILFLKFELFGFIILYMIFKFSIWKDSVYKLFASPITIPILILMFVIGPLSNPFFWFWIGKFYSQKDKL